MVTTDDETSLEPDALDTEDPLRGENPYPRLALNQLPRALEGPKRDELRPYGSLLFDLGARCSLPGSRRARPGQGRCDG